MTPEWFEEERGINQKTLDLFKVRFVGDEVIFPYAYGDKSRYFDEEGKRRFKFTKGMRMSLFLPLGMPGDTCADTAFICEGETDTMRLHQEFYKDIVDDEFLSAPDIYGLGGVDTWRKIDTKGLMDNYHHVFVILDNDGDYNTQNQVDAVWLDIRRTLGPKAKRIRLPEGVKDMCEFFSEGYSLDDLRKLATRGRNVSRFKPLDLTVKPPPADWLVEDFIARGDVTLFSGKEGLGKSWLTQALSVAVVESWGTFLGKTLHHQGGRVLYVDEENPEDVVYDRLKRLGLKSVSNVRYIWNNGIRLDRNADLLFEEVLDYQPTLVVLDSLTRIHSQEENVVGDMGPLLNDAIKPLARETGAAVVLIHHHDKGGYGPRGSSDIPASVDSALDAFEVAFPASFKLKLRKSRRRITGEEIVVHIQNQEDGSVTLETSMSASSIQPSF